MNWSLSPCDHELYLPPIIPYYDLYHPLDFSSIFCHLPDSLTSCTMLIAPIATYASTMNSLVTWQSCTENAMYCNNNWWCLQNWAGLLKPRPYIHWATNLINSCMTELLGSIQVIISKLCFFVEMLMILLQTFEFKVSASFLIVHAVVTPVSRERCPPANSSGRTAATQATDTRKRSIYTQLAESSRQFGTTGKNSKVCTQTTIPAVSSKRILGSSTRWNLSELAK